MPENSRAGWVILTSLAIGGVIGVATQLFTGPVETFLGVNAVVVFGLGIGVVEGPALVSAIILTRRVVRTWVRSSLEASATFFAFFAYVVAYGLLRHPPFTFPFRLF
jgi:hypothetical protein